MTESASDNLYVVVRNERGQYSIWPADKPIPDGWSPQGEAKPKSECLARIEEVWPDPTGAGL